jgi:hypothetical protein
MKSNKKLALVIGINYRDHNSGQLNGCINDSNSLKKSLQRRGYKVTQMNDDMDKKSLHFPSKTNILLALNKLALEAHYHRTWRIFISFSGHGTQMKDAGTFDEVDGKDECIVPHDYRNSGCITDDHISEILKKIPRYTRVFCLFDCCHSGTITDLPFYFDTRYNIRREKNVMWKRQFSPTIVTLSGCLDSQVSYDALINGKYSGAMTHAFLNAIGNSNFIYAHALHRRVLQELRTRGFPQTPKISTNKPYSRSYVLL